jgi:hypothetical protein
MRAPALVAALTGLLVDLGGEVVRLPADVERALEVVVSAWRQAPRRGSELGAAGLWAFASRVTGGTWLATTYAVIAEVANPRLRPRSGGLMRILAERAHHHPDGSVIRVSRNTLDRWLRARTGPAASRGCGRGCAPNAGWCAGTPSSKSRQQGEHRQTRNRSGGWPALNPNTVVRAARCGPGTPSSRSSTGAHSCWSAANASSISDSTPTTRSTRTPAVDRDQVTHQRGLPDPRLPQ